MAVIAPRRKPMTITSGTPPPHHLGAVLLDLGGSFDGLNASHLARPEAGTCQSMFHVVLILACPSLLFNDGDEYPPRSTDAPVPLLSGANEMIDAEFADGFVVFVVVTVSVVIVVLVVVIVRFVFFQRLYFLTFLLLLLLEEIRRRLEVWQLWLMPRPLLGRLPLLLFQQDALGIEVTIRLHPGVVLVAVEEAAGGAGTDVLDVVNDGHLHLPVEADARSALGGLGG